MPSPHSLIMLVGDPDNYRPVIDSIESARKQGFTDFTFYPTALQAAEAARNVEGYTERRAINFTEVRVIEGTKVVLHIMGQMPRPRPVVRQWAERERFDVKWNFKYTELAPPVPPRSEWPKRYRRDIQSRRADAAYNPALNAFAVFIAEWAAKIKNAARSR